MNNAIFFLMEMTQHPDRNVFNYARFESDRICIFIECKLLMC